jgi:hypothetical protein
VIVPMRQIRSGYFRPRSRCALKALSAETERPYQRYFEAMVGFTQPFFITPCDGRKLR